MAGSSTVEKLHDRAIRTGNDELAKAAYMMHREQINDCNTTRRLILSLLGAGMSALVAFVSWPTTNMFVIEHRIFAAPIALLFIWAAMQTERSYCRAIVKFHNRGIAAEQGQPENSRFYDLIDAKFYRWGLTMIEVVYVLLATFWAFIGIWQYGM